MSVAGIQATVNMYSIEESILTMDLSGLMMDLVRASSKVTDIGENYADAKAAINQRAKDDTSYDPTADLAAVKDEYELDMARMNEWETELEAKKQVKETTLKATSSFKESWISLLKKNIPNEFGYCKGSSS